MTAPAATCPTITSRLDGRLLGSQAPDREKVTMVLDGRGDDELGVTLSLPLDDGEPVEAEARQEFGPRMSFRYIAKMNLESERRELIRLLKAMYRSPHGHVLRADPPVNLTPAQLRDALAPLATQGASLYHRLIGAMQPQGFPSGVGRLVHDAALSVFRRSQVLAVTSHAPLFPWAFLYDDVSFTHTDLSRLDATRFWGFRHEIQDDLDGASKMIRIPDPPRIVTAICDDVDGGVHTAPDHPLVLAEDVVATPTARELGAILGAFPRDCLYFYGHADHGEHPVPSSSWLKLRGIELTVDEIDRVHQAPKFKQDVVVVFLNGCRTAPLEEWNSGSVAGFLIQRGDNRVCCIASIAEVPEGFAAAFARQFWSEFLARKPIGAALRNARLTMLGAPSNNPLGLVYSLFGRVDTRICSSRPAGQHSGRANP